MKRKIFVLCSVLAVLVFMPGLYGKDDKGSPKPLSEKSAQEDTTAYYHSPEGQRELARKNAILKKSFDEFRKTMIAELTRTRSLMPIQKYFIRGRFYYANDFAVNDQIRDIGYKTDEDFKKINDAVDIGAIIFVLQNGVLRAVDPIGNTGYLQVGSSDVRKYPDIYFMYFDDVKEWRFSIIRYLCI